MKSPWFPALGFIAAGIFGFDSGWALQTSGLFPANGATGVCADVPLRLHFDQAFSFQYQGTVKVYNAANNQLVYTLNLSQTIPVSDSIHNWPFKDTIGGTAFNYFPILVQGHDAVIQLQRNLFQYGSQYYATVDAGIFRDQNGGSFAGVAAKAWTFTIKSMAPSGANRVIAADGSGDYCTVQGAFEAVPANNNTAIHFTLRTGTYEEIIHLANKNRVTLVGDNRDACVITYRNNNTLNSGTRTRAVFTAEGNDLTLQNFTLTNSTPKGGSQAESLALWGDRCVVDHCHFTSFQDTLLINGRVYFKTCLIEGDVDFIWGVGSVYFDQCEIRSLNKGYVVQARNDQNVRGYVFVGCNLTGTASAAGSVLARTAGDTYLYSEVVYIDCTIGSHIASTGWLVSITDPSKILFAEYGSLDASGKTLNVSQRDSHSKQLSSTQATQYRSVAYVLGGTDNWVPAVPALPVAIRKGNPASRLSRLPQRKMFSFPGNRNVEGRVVPFRSGI